MTQTLNNHIRSQREALGLTEREVADKVGLSIYEYGDIEQYADELLTVTRLDQ